MNVLQHTRNELNLCLQQNQPDRSYSDTLLMPLTGAIHIKSDSYNGEKIDLPLQNEEIKWNHHRASTQTHEC